jgi:hypothetical protein
VFNGQWECPARFSVEVNVTRAPGEPCIRVKRDLVIVAPRHAFAFDCNYIRGTDTPSGFIEGFIVLTIFASDPGDPEDNQVAAAHSFKNLEGIVPPPPNESPQQGRALDRDPGLSTPASPGEPHLR